MTNIPIPDQVFGKTDNLSEEKDQARTLENPTLLGDGTFLSFNPRLISSLSPESYPIEWLWEGFLAKGHLTLFSALWKSGKSTLVAQLLKAIQKGEKFAGQATKPTKVFILSEESEGLWARRKDELDLNSPTSWVLCRPIKQRLSYSQWIELLRKSADFCKENEIDLFIIDTIAGFWNTRDENSASEVGSALLPIKELTTNNIAVLLVHHFRKSGGDEGVASRGSGALGSEADIIIEFTRLEGQNPNDRQRKLRGLSRFEETPVEIVIELVDGEYVLRGTLADVSKEAKLKSVLLILNGEDELTSKEVWENWDTEVFGSRPSQRSIRNYISDLLLDGRAKEIGKKQVGKTIAPTYSTIDNAGKEKTINAGKTLSQNTHFEANNAGKESGNAKGPDNFEIEVEDPT